ncbi:GNAT family N-acetyltransferase [Pelosinus baikalensis]|uniref:GNAT family N-acetyltransferase n=1 Tax=Pelosinus baikalensis TaxID=2892015 RepID=A0ABS8HT12_9FIRM|nr:GNAT family N-acetyltransferase [Pelosinus baikalensis]MCC5466312.1 GNAT family N-acetyltransferase [Pelosinus baikalensis]
MKTVSNQLLWGYYPYNTTSPNLNFAVRTMNPAEATDVVSIIQECYGDSYFYKQYYDPAELVRANESGYLTSVVVVTDKGEIIGHMALLRTIDDPQIVEPIIAVVKPAFRNRGVLTKLAEYLYVYKDPKMFQGVIGIYIPPVTKHIFSQKQVYHHGFKDCGIWLGYLPDAEFIEISTEQSQRLTLVLTYMYIVKPKTLIIYPPQKHKNMVKNLFKNIGVARVQCRIPEKKSENDVNSQSDFRIKADKKLRQAIVKIVRYGKKIIPEISAMLSKFCSEKFVVIHLYLSLNDPLTYYLTPEFEKMGFFFAGIMPGTACKDALVLQYLNNIAIDYNKILLINNNAKEILSYIKKERNC